VTRGCATLKVRIPAWNHILRLHPVRRLGHHGIGETATGHTTKPLAPQDTKKEPKPAV